MIATPADGSQAAPGSLPRPILRTDDLTRVSAALADMKAQLDSGWAVRVREWAGMTQTQLGERIGIDQKTVSAAELGRIHPSVLVALRWHCELAAMENQLLDAGVIHNAIDLVGVAAVTQ